VRALLQGAVHVRACVHAAHASVSTDLPLIRDVH